MDRSEVDKLLDDADQAIAELEKTAESSGKVGKFTIVAVVAVVVIAAVMLGLHTFAEGTVKVDSTTGLLIAVILFAPFVQHLKVLEIGGAKAEFQAAGTGMRSVVTALRAEHGVLKGLAGDSTRDPEEAAEGEAGPATAVPLVPVGPARPLRRVLWLDGSLERSVYEREELAKLFEITTASSLAAANLDEDVIDAVVTVGAGEDDEAGLVAMAAAKPVVVYAPAGTQPGRVVAAAGADVATSLSELVKTMRERARERFDESIARAFRNLGLRTITQDPDGIDYTIVLDSGCRIAIDTPHWLRRPRQRALKARYDRLADAVRSPVVSGALLVTQKAFALPVAPPAGVRPVVLEDLPEVLGEMIRGEVAS